MTRARSGEGTLALKLFDSVFKPPSWAPWRAWLCAVLGLPMSETEAATYRTCTARASAPSGPAREAWCVVGRRGGKSRMAAFLAVWLAAFKKYPRLAEGESAVVLVIAADRRQARVVFGYIVGLLDSIPALAGMITRRTNDTIELSNGLAIEIATASFRSTRGYTIVGAILDEVAFWPTDDAANPDTEVVRALRPSLASVPGSLLLAISSPYAATGELHRQYEKAYGQDGDVLVWQAPTTTMNGTIAQGIVDQALADDPASASAEWLAQFRSDLEKLFAYDALGAVVVRGRREAVPATGIAYTAFVDPSGGSADAMTLGIAHRDIAGIAVLDLVREVNPPFSPENVVADFVRDLKRFNVRHVTGDRYGGEWPREQFRKQGIDYRPSELTRSELYLELLPLVNSRGVALLDQSRLLAQLGALERRVGRSGKDSIDHQRGSHDDVANAAAGALVTAVQSIGVKAPFPTDFTSCLVWNLVPWAPNCFLLGGGHVPGDPTCLRHCSGMRAAVAAYDAYRARTTDEQVKSIATYTGIHFRDNTLTANLKFHRGIEALGL